MGDVAKGIKSFKSGMKNDEEQSADASVKGQPLDERATPALAHHESRS